MSLRLFGKDITASGRDVVKGRHGVVPADSEAAEDASEGVEGVNADEQN